MKNATHTPGPWRIEPLQWDHGASIAIVANSQIIATISPENEDEEPDMYTAKRGPHDEANACLIAAAPKMIEALHLCEDVLSELARLDDGTPSVGALKLIRTAIAEATGAVS